MKITFVFLFSFFVLSLPAQEYYVNIDLNNFSYDKILVEVDFRNFDLDSIVQYNMPTMVPGTYSISDFGRMIDSLYALDIDGNYLRTTRLDTNRWQIHGAQKLEKVKYWVNDSFDELRFSDIFEPGGTNFEEDNFLLNNFGIIGFLDGMDKNPYTIHIIHPERLYGASPMKRKVISSSEEEFYAKNYLQLTDSPIMYAPPDTASVMIGNTKVMVAVYSPSGKSDATSMMTLIEPTLRAQGEYLGGKLPVESYDILVYMHRGRINSGLIGALEHSYSTVFSLSDRNISSYSNFIRSITSHEFFHIITPLTVHSEEIGDYDFNEAKMSKHLWLYEGLTEYSSMRMQVMYGLISPDDFLELIRDKINGSRSYNDSLPFTEMSKGALDKYESQYGNVYQKGALIGMCLDLLLLELSDGSYDIRKLMEKLQTLYGIDRSFKDEELFDVIAEQSFPETREFFERYVEGKEALPITEYLSFAGAVYHPSEIVYMNSLGNISFSFDPSTNALIVNDLSMASSYGKKIGFKEGDVIYKLIGMEVTIDNYTEVFENFYSYDADEKFSIEVLRKNKRGKEKIKTIRTKVHKIEVENDNYISWDQEAIDKQLKVRNSWINNTQ